MVATAALSPAQPASMMRDRAEWSPDALSRPITQGKAEARIKGARCQVVVGRHTTRTDHTTATTSVQMSPGLGAA